MECVCASTAIRDGHELLWNVINYITNFDFDYTTYYGEKKLINITTANKNFFRLDLTIKKLILDRNEKNVVRENKFRTFYFNFTKNKK